MKDMPAAMHRSLMIAIDALRKLSREEMSAAEMRIKEILSLKYEMEDIADRKGYSQACKTSIPICRELAAKGNFRKT